MSTIPSSSATNEFKLTRSLKPAIWSLLAIAFVWVLLTTDLPLLHHPSDYRTKLIADRVLLVPHVLAGCLAILLGPFLFSARFRQRHLKRHRIMGRVYVLCIAIAAPTVLWLSRGQKDGSSYANDAMATVWLLCTLAAFFTARNRQIAAHRQWMIRSYVFTLNFLFTRILNPVPRWANMTDATFALVLLTFSMCYLLFSDLYFNWRELTTPRHL